nr:retrotransposon protein, putative, Ty3-gypsy subclass [Tanacetum cinerariifolium]
MRQRRWLELLKDYNANTQYHLDKANVVADALSRSNLKIQLEIIKDLEFMEVELVVRGSEEDRQAEFWVDDHGVIWYGNRLCVPNDSSLREAVLIEAHSSPFSIHRGSTKIYRDLKNFWWNDGQTKRTIQTMRDVLRLYALEWTGNLDDYLCLIEDVYNNLSEVGELVIEGPETVKVMNKNKVVIAKKKLKEARSRKKSYVDRHQRALEFKTEDSVFLKVSPCKGVRRCDLKGKLSPRFICPFEILDRVGEVSYHLALLPQLSHVHNVFHISLLRGVLVMLVLSGSVRVAVRVQGTSGAATPMYNLIRYDMLLIVVASVDVSTLVSLVPDGVICWVASVKSRASGLKYVRDVVVMSLMIALKQ